MPVALLRDDDRREDEDGAELGGVVLGTGDGELEARDEDGTCVLRVIDGVVMLESDKSARSVDEACGRDWRGDTFVLDVGDGERAPARLEVDAEL